VSFASFIKVTANHPKRSLHISAVTFQLAHTSRRSCDAGMPQGKCATAAFEVTLGHDSVKNEAKRNLSKNLTNMVNSETPDLPSVDRLFPNASSTTITYSDC
jgi:hypothetical protein